MFDAVDPVVVPGPPSHDEGTIDCPGCSTTFTPRRSNQRYCARECQRRSSRNTSRGSRKTENRQRSRRHYERVCHLTEMVYTAPPQERLGVMKHILEFIPHDAGLRNILTDPKLFAQPPRLDGKLNIAMAANAYTQKFYGLSIKRYIKAICSGQEPEGIPLRT